MSGHLVSLRISVWPARFTQLDSLINLNPSFVKWKVPRYMPLLANTKTLPPVYLGPTRVLLS